MVCVLILLSVLASWAQTSPGRGGVSVPHSGEDEISHLKSRAEAGDPAAELELGRAYESGTVVSKNDALAALWYRKAADHGDADAQNRLGLMYMIGNGVDRNKEAAVQWYRKAARQENGAAMFNLGAAYYNGDGVAIDDMLSYVWFLLSQEAGYQAASEAVQRGTSELKPWRVTEALTKIGEMYEKGDGLPNSSAEALKWYRKAADQGSAEASMHIAALVTAGSPTNVNYQEALQRCENAAAQKSPAGATCAGRIYDHGLGVPADAAQAVKWYRRGAELGSASSLLYLGEAYWKGRGVQLNKTAAYMWLLLAARSTIPEARKQEAALRGELSEKEIEKAQKNAIEWQKQHPIFGLANRSPN
jgi:TPR repeat protein